MLGVIPGTDLPDKYVIVGAHYDHLGSSCTLEGGRRHDLQRRHRQRRRRGGRARHRARASRRNPPRRSVIIAFWDREEDGLLGSRRYTAEPAGAARRHGRLRELRHPGREPAAGAAQHHLRGRRRDGRHALPGASSSAGGRRRQSLDTPAVQRDLRPGPQRLRELPERGRAERLLHATRPGPATTRTRTSPGSWTTASSSSRSPRRWRSRASSGTRATRRRGPRTRRSSTTTLVTFAGVVDLAATRPRAASRRRTSRPSCRSRTEVDAIRDDGPGELRARTT